MKLKHLRYGGFVKINVVRKFLHGYVLHEIFNNINSEIIVIAFLFSFHINNTVQEQCTGQYSG